ncbi:MAG: SUMF1/EgtB/PvdO family nonheme iron enzyme [Planctomycetota bacterium]
MRLKILSTSLLAVALLVSAVNVALGGDHAPWPSDWNNWNDPALWATVGNPGNNPDTRYNNISVGAVSYSYKIGKFEVTAGQYTAFLNAMAKTDTYGLYNAHMWSNGECKIQQSGSSGSYTYSVASDYANRPVSYVSWGDAARFCNWLSNGKPAVLEKKVGAGEVLLFSFPATTAWGNMPTQPSFTILMLRAANLLTLGNRSPKNLPVGVPIHGVVSLMDQNTPVHITPPAGQKKDTRPEATTDGRAAFDYVETDHAGFYDVVLDRTPRVTMTYALNPNCEVESNLDQVKDQTLKLDYPGFVFNYIEKSDDFQNRLSGERRGTELWPWLFGAVLALLALESVLTNRWAPRD